MKMRVRLLLITVLAVAAWHGARSLFPERDQQVRTALREAAERRFSARATESREGYGLRLYHDAGGDALDVVLVHGLDEPGKVWMNLAPTLRERGYGVWVMNYPNDQPVADSARLLHAELVRLADAGSREVVIIGHSMGGLVGRELLTNPSLQCSGESCAVGQRPATLRLVMVGTPNHGSELARFRGLAELREQASLAVRGQFTWLGWVFDGAGEAGIDLLPDSRFLSELNARPHPRDTDYAIIAGVIADDERGRLAAAIAGRPELSGLGKVIDATLETVGDGVVSLDSARLEGVPLEIVDGNHTSIVRNLIASSDRTPPAIPLILSLLNAAQGAARGSR